MYKIPDQFKSKQSRLCIGIDPRGDFDRRLPFALSLVDDTAEYAIAYKPNIQFWHGTKRSDMVELTDKIHDYDIPIIADLKISDIGSTNRGALENMYAMGFDYVTHSPFPGNIQETTETAKSIGIGIITLVVMSNPQAKWMIDTGVFREWAKEVEKFVDGAVIGTTNHVTGEILQELALLMPSKFILAPGIGSQGGSSQQLRETFGDRVIYNVSRGINQSKDPKAAARKYYNQVKV